MNKQTIIYISTDEVPALAKCSFILIVLSFAGQAGVEVDYNVEICTSMYATGVVIIGSVKALGQRSRAPVGMGS